MSDRGERPAWSDQDAAKLVGARILVGLTYLESTGPRQEQFFGVVRSADSAKGFEVVLEGSREGETYWLPPDLRSFCPAPAGEYRLRSTGEVVIDPDYTSTWNVTPPEHPAS